MQVIEDARDRLEALTREAARRTGDGAHYLNAMTRKAARRADDGAHIALEEARTGRVSWTVVASALGVGFVTAFALLNSKKAAVSARGAFAGDWREVLEADQKRIERLFASIAAARETQPQKRARLLDLLSAALTRNALQKENAVYPALRGADQGASSTHLAAEQFEIKTYLYELAGLETDDPRWTRKLAALRKLVHEHLEEEGAVFLRFQERLSDADNARLTRAVNREALKLA